MLEKQIDDVIWTMDMNFRLTYISPLLKRMFGYTVAEMMQIKFAGLPGAGIRSKSS